MCIYHLLMKCTWLTRAGIAISRTCTRIRWWGRRKPQLPQVYLPIGWSTYFFGAARVQPFNLTEVARAKDQVGPRTHLRILNSKFSTMLTYVLGRSDARCRAGTVGILRAAQRVGAHFDHGWR